MIRRFVSVEAFYLADERRRRSVEVDFGVHWRLAFGLPPWRASWIEDTGELVAVKLWPGPLGGTSMYRGASGPVHVLASGLAEIEDVEGLLRGWEDVCGRRGSLLWLQDRCASLAGASGC